MAQRSIFKRRCTSRVRSGCITCKARHVKCDEKRPGCNQCLSRDVACGGYEFTMLAYQRTESIRQPPSSEVMAGSAQVERELFARFVQRGQHVTYGIIDNGPLHILLCHIAHREPGIWHGIVALEYSSQRTRDLALAQHGKVLTVLRRRLAEPPQVTSIIIILLLCLLCVPFELMHRGEQAAARHLDGAMAIFHFIERKKGFANSGHNRALLLQLQEVFEELQCQYSTHAANYGELLALRDKKDATSTSVHIPTSGRSIIQSPALGPSALDDLRKYDQLTLWHFGAYRRFTILLARSVLEMQAFVESIEANLDFLVAQKKVLRVLSLWASAMQQHLSETLSAQQQQRLRLFAMFYHQAKIIVTTMHLSGSTNHDVAYNGHLEDFRQIVHLAGTAASAEPSAQIGGHSGQADFGLHVGAVQPLHFTATKCPDPNIRRDALQLLKGPYAQREGWWSGHNAEVTAVRTA